MRALALDRASHEATASRKLTLEVEDSRGNKVFKKITQTDAYGVASAEFGAGRRSQPGHLSPARPDGLEYAEIALNVERYVLPKFKVAVEFAGKDNHAKRGYRPGDHVTGTVRANYFFGKAVDGVEITVKASAMDVAMVDAGSTRGKTDGDGAYKFDLPLPAYFAGLPLNHGTARVLIEATVKDSAGHAETRAFTVSAARSPSTGSRRATWQPFQAAFYDACVAHGFGECDDFNSRARRRRAASSPATSATASACRPPSPTWPGPGAGPILRSGPASSSTR